MAGPKPKRPMPPTPLAPPFKKGKAPKYIAA